MRYLLTLMTLCSTWAFALQGAQADDSLYDARGTLKPKVVVLPVIDSSEERLVDWDLSKEMTEEMRKKIFNSSKLYLLRETVSMEVARQLNQAEPKEIASLSLTGLEPADFIIVTELVDHRDTPFGLPASDKPYFEEIKSKLNLAMRVKVLDVRKQKPRVILQEIVEHEHDVYRPYLNPDYSRVRWGTEAFERTPLGMAHHRLLREIVARVEGYVFSNRV